jgi:FkbH-like protein
MRTGRQTACDNTKPLRILLREAGAMSPLRPQAWELVDIPLHKLVIAGRKVEREQCALSTRIAVTGDAATQHYCQALSATLKLRGCWPEIYEAEFDMIRQELLNPASELYAHEPQFIVLFMSVQTLAQKFWTTPVKATFADEVIEEILQLWRAARERTKATIVQHNFAMPLERPYGNQSLLDVGTFAGAVNRINARLAEVAADEGVRLFDTEFQSAYYGKRQWFDERLWCQARQALSPSFLPSLAKALSDTVLADLGVGVKCVVVDLDNTMWGGILGDDGPENIEIGQTEVGLVFSRLQRTLMELKDRGVLLAVCSKNLREQVLDVLDNHPDMLLRTRDFVQIVANHEDKVSGIRVIRETLNIGLDSFVFLDDSPFERNMVREALPQVQVPELPEEAANIGSALARWHLFEGRAATAEDRARLDYYQADTARDGLKGKYEGLDAYLEALAMKAEVRGFDGYTLPRVHQLVQRSNQFNLTTIRYSEAELASLVSDPAADTISIRLTDRFGDNGIVVTAILREDSPDLIVDTWIMSCRVLGRKVEEFTVGLMVECALARGATRIVGRYIPTEKNSLVSELYPRLGFTPAGVDSGTQIFTLDIATWNPGALPIAHQLSPKE